MTAPPPPSPKFSRIQIIEAAAGSALAAAIIATSGGMFWLIASLPNKLTGLERDIRQILGNQNRLETRLESVWREVREQDRRLIRLEMQ